MAEVAAAAPGVPATLRGALDGLDDAAIAALAPEDGPDTLYTQLPDGRDIRLSKHAIAGRMAAMVEEAAGVVLLGCTGDFAEIPPRPTLVRPSPVLNALSAALLPQGRLGVLVPLPEQVPVLEALRTRPGVLVKAVPLKPFSDDAARDAAAGALAGFRPDLVLLDCISFTRADRTRVAERLGVPVLLAVDVAARTAAALA